jgi:preprotein translocase subunit SecF
MKHSRKARKVERLKKTKEPIVQENEPKLVEEKIVTARNEQKNFFLRIYDEQYRKLLFIPILLLLFAIIAIGMNIVQTGDFVNKGVSLKGGIIFTVPTEISITSEEITSILHNQLPNSDVSVRLISEFGVQKGFIIEAADITESELLLTLETRIPNLRDFYSAETIGSSLGDSFFKQTLFAIFVAFIFMGLVVFYYFRSLVPSAAVILAALSDIIITLAIVDFFGMKLSTAGIAAFLMLIGYSVDTDILLSTRVLKNKEGTVLSRILSAMKTGLTMTATTLVAITVALLVTQSEVIRQIMVILLVGLLVDLVNTWIQNVAIIRIYLDKKGVK